MNTLSFGSIASCYGNLRYGVKGTPDYGEMNAKGARHVYSPCFVVETLLSGEYSSYWTITETYEFLKCYIAINFQGLRDDVIAILGGERRRIDPQFFQGNLASFESRDDVLTLLVYLGYLTYDYDTEEVFIPNERVMGDLSAL